MTRADRVRSRLHRRRALAFVVVLALLLFLGLRPEGLPEAFAGEDKVHHAVGFAALTVTLRIASPRRHILGVVVVALAIGLAIELGQLLHPHRSASAADMLANAIGVAAGAAASIMGRAWLRARERSAIER